RPEERFVVAGRQPDGPREDARVAPAALGGALAQLPRELARVELEDPGIAAPRLAAIVAGVPHRRDPGERAAVVGAFGADRLDAQILRRGEREDRRLDLARVEVPQVHARGLG